jgi:hypothetical protein
VVGKPPGRMKALTAWHGAHTRSPDIAREWTVRGADGGASNGMGGPMLSRRALLRAGALVAVAGPLVAACTTQPAAAPPDPLQPLLTAATTDATTAKAAATAFADNGATLAVIASVRQVQATALRSEVNRAAGVTATTQPSASRTPKPSDESTVTAQLIAALATAQHQAAALMPRLPRYRSGLVGSVAAGCASLSEALHSTPITAAAATSASPAPSGGSATLNDAGVPSGSVAPSVPPSTAPSTTLPGDTTAALQQALSAEHAALWLYGTASAFITGSAETEIAAAMTSVQNLRDATEQWLTSGGATPQPAQPAYLVPKPVTNQPSALAALGIAESDATVAWRSVLEHTDDAKLRDAALAALIDSAVRQTRWRRLSGQSPASIPMPGQAA